MYTLKRTVNKEWLNYDYDNKVIEKTSLKLELLDSSSLLEIFQNLFAYQVVSKFYNKDKIQIHVSHSTVLGELGVGLQPICQEETVYYQVQDKDFTVLLDACYVEIVVSKYVTLGIDLPVTKEIDIPDITYITKPPKSNFDNILKLN